MISIVLAIQIASAPSAPPALLAEWNSCVLDYAQVEGAGKDSDVTVALRGLDLCEPQKQRYVRALPSNVQGDQVDQEQRTISLRVIAFLRRMRGS